MIQISAGSEVFIIYGLIYSRVNVRGEEKGEEEKKGEERRGSFWQLFSLLSSHTRAIHRLLTASSEGIALPGINSHTMFQLSDTFLLFVSQLSV